MVRHDLATTWHQVRGMKYICVDVDQMDPNGHTYVMTLLAEQLMQSRYLSACGTYSLRTYHTHFIFSHLRFMYDIYQISCLAQQYLAPRMLGSMMYLVHIFVNLRFGCLPSVDLRLSLSCCKYCCCGSSIFCSCHVTSDYM